MADREAALDVLAQALNDPEQSANHERIRAVLRKNGRTVGGGPPEVAAKRSATAETPKMTVNLGLGEREYEDTNAPVPRVVRGLKRMGDALSTPAMLASEFVNSATFGAPRAIERGVTKLTGTQIGPTQEEIAASEAAHPNLTAWARFAGNVTPGGGPARIAQAGSRAVDPLLRTVLKRAASAPARVAAKAGAGAVVGAGTAAGTAGISKLVEGGDSGQALEAMGRAAPVGAAVGGGLSVLGAAGGEAAAAMRARNPDLQALDRAGLEPSPIPGRPVVRQNQSLMSQLPGRSEPPLVSKATPETRTSAGRVAADQIVPDITARSKANNQRFGALKVQILAAEGSNPAPFQHIVRDIETRLADQSLPDATRNALMKVREKFAPYSPPPPPPQLVELQQMLANASPASRAGIQQAIQQVQAQLPQPRPFTARDLDQIRDYADSFVRSGEIKKGDVQFIQVAGNMRQTLDQAAPGLARLNAQQSDVLKGFEKRKALLGMKRSQRGEGEDVYEAVARRASEPGEETKAAGAKRGAEGSSIERAGRMGEPPVLPGADVPPDVGYQSLLNIPRLQLAQERFQVNPSAIFSGAGGTTVGPLTAVGRVITRTPARVFYPAARRLGDMELGGKPAAADQLIGAVRRRRDKKKKSNEEATP